MDEAHALKNRNASRTTRLRRVSNVSRRRIMMTGAPAGWRWAALRWAGQRRAATSSGWPASIHLVRQRL